MKYYTMAVVVDQHREFKPFCRSLRCRLQSYTHLEYSNCEIDQNDLVNSLREAFEVASIHRSFSTPCLSLVEEVDNKPRIKIVVGDGSTRLHGVIVEAAKALASGVDPVPVSSGLGGAYILRNENGVNVAVAKPIDEEPFACNNPKGFVGRLVGQPGMRRSVRIGETGIRELAAYLLDYGGFAGVPPTALVEISHVGFHVNSSVGISTAPCKIASLQSFVEHDCDAGELGPSSFSVASVHRVGILDIRLLNLDRHAGNLLVKKKQRHDNCNVGGVELVPIDHGLCLPEWLDDPYFEWLHWPQASVPFSETELEYIANLDPFKDAELLTTELPAIREASIRILILCTIFLKKAVAFGLCLADIGEMMTRGFGSGEETLSALENLCARAMGNVPIIISGEHETKLENGDPEMFQFEGESKDGHSKEVLDPQLQETLEILKPPKVPKFPCPTTGSKTTARLSRTEIDKNRYNDDNNDMFLKSSNHGSLIKSKSFSVQNLQSESGAILFGEMSKEEWELFLNSFEKLLPEALEKTRCVGGPKLQRMGTSCKF
ncbi:phosphatidylinositol 4-kinase gamma 1 [Momordica charantia]|uniref:1-phosphatidylinositol 4-kinase n=1 Tax=Momordica charantia TaxID=3673 RepID=A0A6J1DLX5_MOMCH|nr:phosphatidylinositol 4-kinase gamma 1 [Momordica charantia]XP_022154532.1 phosphatidylinositol 4-kinase gamma 1 [Momordica charantia]